MALKIQIYESDIHEINLIDVFTIAHEIYKGKLLTRLYHDRSGSEYRGLRPRVLELRYRP